MSAAGSDEAVALVQQEMSNLKALKRLSMGTQTSPLDPDLPQLQAQRSPSPPSSGSDQRDSSFIGQTPSTVPLHDHESDIDHPNEVDGNTPLGLAKELWVPAHVHPEIAPNEWRSFVEEKLSEIQSNSKEKHMSRLSHVVTDRDEYMDASELLAKRRRSSGDQRRRSILELSEQLSSLDEFDSLLTTVSVPPSSDKPIVPAGGASLRRTKHSTRRPRRFPLRSDSSSSSPASFGERSSSRELASVERHPPASAPSPSVTSGADISKGPVTQPVVDHQRRNPNLTIYTGPVATARSVQPPSPSAATPPPGGSNLLSYRRRPKNLLSVHSTATGQNRTPLPPTPSPYVSSSTLPDAEGGSSSPEVKEASSDLYPEQKVAQALPKREAKREPYSEQQVQSISDQEPHPQPKPVLKAHPGAQEQVEAQPRVELEQPTEEQPEEERKVSKSQSLSFDQRWRWLKDETQSSKLVTIFKKKKDELKRGHTRTASRPTNVADTVEKSPEPSETESDSEVDPETRSRDKPELQLPYDIPAHQITDRSIVMMYHRFPLHIERAIYRLSHMKLANPRRPLSQQVMLSNFMYAYLNLINHGYQQQYLQSQGIEPDPNTYPCGIPAPPPTEENMANLNPAGYDSSSSSSDSDSDWEKGQAHV